MNAPTTFRNPYGDECRKRDRIQAVRDRWYREWLRISSEMHDEIERIKRGDA